MQHNYWPHASSPGIPTLYSLEDSGSVRVLWALEELVEHKHLEKYNLKSFKRERPTFKAPEAMKEGFRLGTAPILTVSPASAPEEPPIPFAEGRLILRFLRDHYANGLWDQPTPEDEARNAFLQEFAGTSFNTQTSLTLTIALIPGATPWPLRPLLSLIFMPVLSVFKKRFVEQFRFLEDSLSEQKPWFSGSRLGEADFCVVFPLATCVKNGFFEAEKYPKTARWYHIVSEMPTYQRAVKQMAS